MMVDSAAAPAGWAAIAAAPAAGSAVTVRPSATSSGARVTVTAVRVDPSTAPKALRAVLSPDDDRAPPSPETPDSIVVSRRASTASTGTQSLSRLSIGHRSSSSDPKGYRRIRMRHDSACLFLAVALQVFPTQPDHTRLRRMVVEHLRGNQHLYENDVARLGSLEDYLAAMNLDDAWGGKAELRAIADLFKREVVVVYGNGDDWRCGQGEPPIMLAGGADNQHFDALVPVQWPALEAVSEHEHRDLSTDNRTRSTDAQPPGEQRTRKTGKVKFFNTQKGYGFIIPADGGADLFVHHTAVVAAQDGVLKSLLENEPVEYDVVPGPKGVQAAHVTGPSGAPVRGDPSSVVAAAMAVSSMLVPGVMPVVMPPGGRMRRDSGGPGGMGLVPVAGPARVNGAPAANVPYPPYYVAVPALQQGHVQPQLPAQAPGALAGMYPYFFPSPSQLYYGGYYDVTAMSPAAPRRTESSGATTGASSATSGAGSPVLAALPGAQVFFHPYSQQYYYASAAGIHEQPQPQQAPQASPDTPQ